MDERFNINLTILWLITLIVGLEVLSTGHGLCRALERNLVANHPYKISKVTGKL